MTTISKFKKFGLILLALGAITLTSCEKEDEETETPAEEHDHEVITDVHLVFTNANDSTEVLEFSAQDPDGEGIEELSVLDTIQLDTNELSPKFILELITHSYEMVVNNMSKKQRKELGFEQ